jgi:hypothetical protein
VSEPGWWSRPADQPGPRPPEEGPGAPTGQAPTGQAPTQPIEQPPPYYPTQPIQQPIAQPAAGPPAPPVRPPVAQRPTLPIGPTGSFGPLQDLGRPQPARRRRGRGWAALVVVLVCLGLLAAAADRGAALVAERALGRGVQQEQGLARPAVASISGFPFLTQALRGRYRQVDLVADAVPTGAGLTVDRVTVRLTDVSAGVSDLLAGRTDRLRAGRVAVRARVGYPTLNALVAERVDADRLAVRLSDGGGNRLEVVGTVRTVLGRLQVRGLLKATLVGKGIRLQLVPGSVAGLPAVADRLLADLLDVTLEAPTQVSGIRPTGVEVAADGVTLTGTGTDVPLGDLRSS